MWLILKNKDLQYIKSIQQDLLSNSYITIIDVGMHTNCEPNGKSGDKKRVKVNYVLKQWRNPPMERLDRDQSIHNLFFFNLFFPSVFVIAQRFSDLM